MAATEDVIREFDTALLLMNDGTRQFAEVVPGRSVRMRKGFFPAMALLGVPYGGVYELTAGAPAPLRLVESGELLPTLDLDAVGSGADNRDLVDRGDAQALGPDDIARLKKGGADGTAILSALIEGSATFASKTAFSQEKWLKKKGAKHVQRFRVVRTTPLNVAETALMKHGDKIGGLRVDALALMLTHADVRPGVTALVGDGVSGLLLAAAAHRMGNVGTLVTPVPRDDGCPMLGYLPKLNLGGGGGAGGAPSSSSSSSGSAAAAAGADGGLRIVGVSYKQLTAWAEAGPFVHRAAAGAAGKDSSSSSSSATAASAEGAAADADADAVGDEAPTEAPAPGAKRRREAGDDAEGGDNDDVGDAAADGDAGADGIDAEPAAASSSSSAAVARGAAAAAAASSSGGGGGGNPHVVRPSRMGDGAKRALLFGSIAPPPAPGSSGSGAAPTVVTPGGVDCVVLAVPAYDPLPLLLAAIRCAKPGAPFAVFCPQLAPLGAASAYLRTHGLALNTMLAEVWQREYQVLPNRTHPAMSMHGASGHVLTGVLADGGRFGRTAGVLFGGASPAPGGAGDGDV
jgi:hypothetical protein